MIVYHKSKFGRFGKNLRSDDDGYVYLTATGWLTSGLDGMTVERAEELQKVAIEKTAVAEAGLTQWRKDVLAELFLEE